MRTQCSTLRIINMPQKDRHLQIQTEIYQKKRRFKLTREKRKLIQEVMPTARDWHKCGSLVLTSWRKLLCLTYNALGANMTVRLKYCDSSAISKAKACAFRKNKYVQATNPVERFFWHNWSIPRKFISESLIDWCSTLLQPLLLEII